MHERVQQWYQRQYERFQQAGAFNEWDLQLYASVINAKTPSETQLLDLKALTKQGNHYVETGRVAYFIDGELVPEQELLEKVRTILGTSSDRFEKETLLEIVRFTEQKLTLRRPNIQRLEKIFAIGADQRKEYSQRKKQRIW